MGGAKFQKYVRSFTLELQMQAARVLGKSEAAVGFPYSSSHDYFDSGFLFELVTSDVTVMRNDDRDGLMIVRLRKSQSERVGICNDVSLAPRCVPRPCHDYAPAIAR